MKNEKLQNIVSIIASSSGKAIIYQRKNGKVTSTVQLFDNWIISQDISNVKSNCEIVELESSLPFKYLIKSTNINAIAKEFGYLSAGGAQAGKEIIKYNNLQQYLIASGNSYFEGMEFDQLYRMQFDLETTTNNPKYISDPQIDEIYLITVTDTKGYEEAITGAEPDIIQRLIDVVQEKDPDLLENHNIFGFDLPFLYERAKKHGIKLTLGRDGSEIWSYEDSVKIGGQSEKFQRFVINGREVIDTMFLTRRRVPNLRSRGYGLKNTAKYLGVATENRTYIDGSKIYDTWKKDPNIVIEYALDDVREVRAISDKLLPVDFELTKTFPDKLDKVATAGTATMIDMLFVSEYLKASHSIPKPTPKKDKFTGGLTEIYRKGIFHDVVKADVSSLYPSIMLTHRIGPDNDPLNIFQKELKHLTNQRLKAKSNLQELLPSPLAEGIEGGSPEYQAADAYQTGLKLIINSFYGYLGAEFTHFNSPSSAAKVTVTGRDILSDMIEIIEKIGGVPIEADTDGVYFSGIKVDEAAFFVKKINNELSRKGITIDFDGYWQAMFSYSKKSYVLQKKDCTLIKKGVFNKGDEEKFIHDFKLKTVKNLFSGNIKQINRSYREVLEKVRKGKLSIDDIVKSQRLGKDLEKYGNTYAPHIQVLKEAGIDAKQGYLVEYYKDTNGWKLATDFDGKYDVEHYTFRLNSVINTTFDPLFLKADKKVIFSQNETDINLDGIKTKAVEVEEEPQIYEEAEAEPWIELSFGNKIEEIPDRWNWIRLSDMDAIIDFVEKHDYLDCHRSNLAYWSAEAPVANLSRYKQLGDYFLEIEGKDTDSKDLFGDTIEGDKSVNDQVIECAKEVVNRLIELGVEEKDIVVYYNGGKSIYIFFPMDYICAFPRYRLNEVYKAITEEQIISLLPEKLQKLIDTQVYDAKHTLRLPNTKHHKGRFGYTIELDDLYNKTWEQLTRKLVSQIDVRATFTNTPQIPEDDTLFIKDFASVAKKIENTPRTSKERLGKSKAKAYRDHIREVEYILNSLDYTYIQPCILNIAKAISKSESIGFGGRNKFISELLIFYRAKGFSDREIENKICNLFIQNGDANRYGVLEVDRRVEPNPCGYRLKEKYFDIEKLESFDPSCQICKEFCDPANCHRHQQFKTKEKTTPYHHFLEEGRTNTADAINQTDSDCGLGNADCEVSRTSVSLVRTSVPLVRKGKKENSIRIPNFKFRNRDDGITAIDAPLSSGKTYQICRKAVDLANSGELSIIFTHSHDASQECCDNIKKMVKGQRDKEAKGNVECRTDSAISNLSGVCVNMRGKSGLTCLAEHRNCQNCRFRGEFFTSDKEKRESARENLVAKCQGQVIDLKKAQKLAEKYDVCPYVIMRALSITMRTGIVITNHNYLGDVNLHPILNEIHANYYFVDEADQLITNIISRYQDKMVVARTRSNLQHTYRESCGNKCDKCYLHFADIFDRGMDTRGAIKSSEVEQIQTPQNFIETLKNAVSTVRELPSGTIYEVFNHDALKKNIDRLEKVLSLIDTEATPYDAITELEKKLIETIFDFVTVDKIYEGVTTYDGTVIFPDENIVSIQVENPIDQNAVLGLFFDPDPDNFDDLQNNNQQLTYTKLFPDSETRVSLHGTETESAIKICLAFANLCIKGNGKIGLYFETRRIYEDTTIPNNKQNLMSCGLSLRVFDKEGFMEVSDKMKRRNTLLLSGTFISYEMLAKSLLLSPSDIRYIDVTEPMHDQFLIIHTDRKGAKTDGVKISSIGNKHLTQIYRRVAELLDEVYILNFEKNTNQGNIYFHNLNADPEKNGEFYIENLCQKTAQVADWCTYEHNINREKNKRVLTVDKLRSSQARAVNRALFYVCTVHGNGYVDWYDFLPYVQKIRDTVDPDIQLDDMFEYDRRKVVAQALTRAPRDENRTVGLYFGDMPYIDYPEYLKPCVVLIDELLAELKQRYEEEFICNIETQIELTARVIAGFIKGEVSHDDFSAAFEDFEFVGEYEGGKREGRKVEVDLSDLDEKDRYTVMSFVEKYKEKTDNAKVINAVVDKLKHIKNCIVDRGYLDKKDNKKGTRLEWNDFINHLGEIGYLKQKKIKIEGKGRPKTVFEIA